MGGLLPKSQRLHVWFWRKTSASSALCLGFGFLFGLPMQRIPVDMEDRMFDS